MVDRSALHSRKPWLPLVVTLALMAGLGGWVVWQWQVQEDRIRAEQAQRFNLAVNDVESNLRERMRAYEMVMRGLAGLFVGGESVKLDEWNRYLQHFFEWERQNALDVWGPLSFNHLPSLAGARGGAGAGLRFRPPQTC